MEPHWVGEMDVCSPHLDHMTKVASTPIYGKHSSEKALGLGMQHWGHGPNKIRKMISLG